MKNQWKQGWLEAERKASIHGWDFSYIEGKYEQEELPWDYRTEVRKYLQADSKILDMDTGGGEFLLSLNHPPQLCSVTEAYAPNVLLCKEKLIPLGIDVHEATGSGKLPFADEQFDVVLNRHGDFNAEEIYRVLKRDGIFITQQVGAENDRELVEQLLPHLPPLPFPQQYLNLAEEQFRKAGFEILDGRECHVPIRFFDLEALIWFARIIQWEFINFSVESSLEKLYGLQEQLNCGKAIEGRIHRFLLVAQKCK